MGDDKWTIREPGSVTGSYVPPPVVPEEPPSNRPPLPRRKPQAQRRPPRRASTNEPPAPPAPEFVRHAPGSANSDQLKPGPTGRASGSTGPSSSRKRLKRRVSGSGQRRVQVAQPDVTVPSQLPDNVRYLFRPVLTQAAPVADPVDIGARRQREADEQPADEQSAGMRSAGEERRPRAGRGRTQAGSAEASDDDLAAIAEALRAARRARREGQARWRMTWAAAVTLITATLIGTAFALLRQQPSATSTHLVSAGSHRPQTPSGNGQTGANALKGLSSAAIIRGQAARWIAGEIGKNMIIACDDVMCGDLVKDGIAASNLLVLSSTAPDPLGADIVVGTPALRSQFGARLATEYAPAVIASFGTGKSQVDVRVVAPDGAVAYDLAANRDLAARQRNGSTLLRNSRVAVAASAQPELIAGLVDSRLLMMLPVLAGQHPIRILGFYDRAPRSAQGVPLTGAELVGADSASGLSGSSYLRWLLTFLRGQRAPFRPVSVTTGRVHGHEVVVRVRFARPSLIGLFNRQ
jgi:hypothetical protein